MRDLDTALVDRAKAGELKAIHQLIDVLQRPIFGMALRMMGRHEDAEEATQEALLRIVTHLGSFRGESAVSTWAWSVATRVVLAHRKRRSRGPVTVAFFERDLATDREEHAAERVDDAIYLQQVKLGCGRAMLQILDDDHRMAYILGEILDVPGPEAARALGISAVAYRKRLSRSRVDLRAALMSLCGVVNADASCRCHRRLAPARRQGRLAEKDRPKPGEMHEVHRLRAQIAQLEDLSRVRVFYRADPRGGAEPQWVARIRAVLC